MRYNIKRLVNEILTYQRTLKKVLAEKEKELKINGYSSKWGQMNSEANSKRHAISLCIRYIGDEVVTRLKEGKNLDSEIEEVFLIK